MGEYDVIVAGAGPAGLSTAIELSRRKVKTLLLEAREIGRCGKVWSCFEDQIKKHKLQNCIIHKCKNVVVSSYTGTKVSVPAPLVMLDERKILMNLKKRVDRKYCTIKEHSPYVDFKNEDDGITIKTRKKEYRSKILIDCSGINSPVVKRYNLQKKTIYMQVYGWLLEKSNANQNDAVVFDIGFDSPNNTYFWVEPVGRKKVWVGTTNFVKGSKTVHTRLLDQDLKKYLKAKKMSGKVQERRFGKVPFYDTYKTYKDNILLVGDAAAQIPTTGYGLITSIESGKLAANVAAKSIKQKKYDKRFLKEYEILWKKNIGISYYYMLVNKYLIVNFSIKDFEKFLKILALRPKKEIISGIRQTLSVREIQAMSKDVKKSFSLVDLVRVLPFSDYFPFIQAVLRFARKARGH